MRKFHGFSRQVLQEHPSRWLPLKFAPLQEWERCSVGRWILVVVGRLSCGTNGAGSIFKYWYYFSDQAYQAISELRSQKAEDNEVICYHDWAYHNLLIDPVRPDSAYLFDLDSLLVDQAVHDRANLFRLYLRLWRWSLPAFFKLLWQFDRDYPWRKGELRLLHTYLTFPYDYWILGRQYYLERQPWSARYYQEQWQRKIESCQARELCLEYLIKI